MKIPSYSASFPGPCPATCICSLQYMYRRGEAGFHTEGGAGIFPSSHNFPSPEILKLSMVIIVVPSL